MTRSIKPLRLEFGFWYWMHYLDTMLCVSLRKYMERKLERRRVTDRDGNKIPPPLRWQVNPNKVSSATVRIGQDKIISIDAASPYPGTCFAYHFLFLSLFPSISYIFNVCSHRVLSLAIKHFLWCKGRQLQPILQLWRILFLLLFSF